ncbi:MAG: hypothetical protein J0L92_41535 [Deltaproteobacteria bacterium]|nr:hypothetical protein [Deltaproteobacteria bacterium]
MSMQKQAVDAARKYLRKRPQEITRAVWNLLGLRVGVPIDAIRWMLTQAEKSGKVKDPVVTEVPPGLRVTATIDAMKTPLRASAVVYIDRMHVTPDQIRIDIRLEEIWAEVLNGATGPVAALISSGALDLSKPGNLAKYLPLPPTVVETKDNRIVLDLMKDPKIAGNPRVRRILSLITPVVTANGLETDDDHLEVTFRPLPDGVRPAASAIRRHLLSPGLKRIRALLPA